VISDRGGLRSFVSLLLAFEQHEEVYEVVHARARFRAEVLGPRVVRSRGAVTEFVGAA